jgi:hypothetical protein
MVGDTVFTASPTNTVGTPLKDIKEGDKVTIRYQKSMSGPINNATSITKVQ